MRSLVIVLFAILLGSFPQLARAEQRLALIVTNQRYPAEIGALSKSHADGEILRQALLNVGFDVRLVQDVDKAGMLEAISAYAEHLEKAGPDAVGLFYFSGHGAATEKFGDNYLIPIGAQISTQLQLTTLSVKLGEVVEALSKTNAQINFVVIDACRNVAFSPVRGQRGLKPEAERKDALIAFSTGPGDVAVDGNVFSSALAEQISQPGREALQVFRAVRLKVLDATDNRQFPWTRDGLVRDFWFAGPPPADPNATQLKATRMLAEWEAIKDSGEPALLEKFERRYFGEILSGEAQRRRIALGVPGQVARAPKPGTPITVWNVASPHPGVADLNGVVPLKLERRATALGHVIEVKVVPAKEFATQLFRAMETGTQPDIISIDNYGHLEGVTTDLGKFVGVQTNTQVRQSLVVVEEVLSEFARGWQFLLRGSPSHENARALVEDLVECNEQLLQSGSADRSDLRRASESAAAAHVECRPFDGDISDPERFQTTCRQDRAPVRVKVIKTCRISGNARLAFASSVVAIDNHERIGRRSVISILRKTDKWRVLTVTADPVSAKEFASDAALFGGRLVARTGASRETPGRSAIIQTSDGTFPSPKAGERFGDFTWTSSPSKEIKGEIAEFSYGFDVRLFLYPGAAPGQKRSLSTGKLYSRTPWLWRIWSIGNDGSVTFTDTRQFRN